jgi:aerobic-type carbon monoxide dehydrogenase small subunit (CoxS/CutS family)
VATQDAAVSYGKPITVTINGTEYEREVEARKLLIHFIRDDLDLTGSHIGCDTGNCGACSVLVDGTLVKSCMMLAVQADGSSIETVEGLASSDELTGLQQAFKDHHALQCGYCTPGMLMSATALLRSNLDPSEDEIKKALQGNICRCTGYWNIFEAVHDAARAGAA